MKLNWQQLQTFDRCLFVSFGFVPSPTPNVVKKDIMKKSLQEWKLLESIERAELEIDGLVKRWGGKLNFENDLQQYVQDLKKTVEVLMKAWCKQLKFLRY